MNMVELNKFCTKTQMDPEQDYKMVNSIAAKTAGDQEGVRAYSMDFDDHLAALLAGRQDGEAYGSLQECARKIGQGTCQIWSYSTETHQIERITQLTLPIEV